MISYFKRAMDNFRGSGEAAVTVPSLDGAIRPNHLLERAKVAATAEAPDQIVASDGTVLYSSGPSLYLLGDGTEFHRFDSTISAVAAGPDGVLAVGLTQGCAQIVGGRHDGVVLEEAFSCPVALLFDGADTLFVANGSAQYPANQWKHDLMSKGCSGSVWRVNLANQQAERIMDKLAWPYGLGLSPGGLIVTEAWKHRVSQRGSDGKVTHVLNDLPGYPARISPTADGGWWLAVFAPRNQLTEFILRESVFRARMMAEIEPDHWAAPALEQSDTYMRPLQGGAQKHLGVVKPWAPALSYGLVIRLDHKLYPLFSQHSRADGRRHGITSVVEIDQQVYAASKGGDVVLALTDIKERATV